MWEVSIVTRTYWVVFSYIIKVIFHKLGSNSFEQKYSRLKINDELISYHSHWNRICNRFSIYQNHAWQEVVLLKSMWQFPKCYNTIDHIDGVIWNANKLIINEAPRAKVLGSIQYWFTCRRFVWNRVRHSIHGIRKLYIMNITYYNVSMEEICIQLNVDCRSNFIMTRN